MSFPNPDQLVDELLKGGLIIAPRRYGKTQALLRVLRILPDALVVVPTEISKRLLLDGDPDEHLLSPRVKVGNHWDGRAPGYKVFVDEYFHNPYRGPFFAAICSTDFRVKIVQPEIEDLISNRPLLQQAQEHPNDFCLFDMGNRNER